jgi:SAM-dependent methyltransferase
VYFGSRVAIIADAHDVPFLEGSFDGVVAQAVLEHVVDPYRCAAEIHRVLKVGGLVYAETPFLFPVHLGPYDFTRFTPGGHRRLFRYFTEVESGVIGGPGMALALSIRSFVRSCLGEGAIALAADVVLPFFIFWLKYWDRWLLRSPQAADYAATMYFLGSKTDEPVPDRAIIDTHWSRGPRGRSPGRRGAPTL